MGVGSNPTSDIKLLRHAQRAWGCLKSVSKSECALCNSQLSSLVTLAGSLWGSPPICWKFLPLNLFDVACIVLSISMLCVDVPTKALKNSLTAGPQKILVNFGMAPQNFVSGPISAVDSALDF